jgi:hypothetical protein
MLSRKLSFALAAAFLFVGAPAFAADQGRSQPENGAFAAKHDCTPSHAKAHGAMHERGAARVTDKNQEFASERSRTRSAELDLSDRSMDAGG